jgi:integrase
MSFWQSPNRPDRGWPEADVAAPLKRPRRQRPEDVQVVSVGADDVRKLIQACQDMQELICVTTAAYLGARRAALARIRRGDVDLVQGTVRVLEKGER